MIAKVLTGTNVYGLIHYLTKKKHQVLSSNKMFPDANLNYVSSEFKQIQSLNSRCKKNIMHIILAFSPEENINSENMKDIAEKFLKEFGANDNQWLNIQHFNTKHKHCHIIVNRVKMNGKLLSDSFSHLKAKRICRELEQLFSLKQLSNKKTENLNIGLTELRKHIDDSIRKSKNFKEFSELIEHKGYKVLKRRGVSFLNKSNGCKIKGSALGREYSLTNINKRIFGVNYSGTTKESLSAALNKEYEDVKEIIVANNENDFKAIGNSLIGNINNHQIDHKRKKKKTNKKRKL